jgi:aminoglycoside 6'-N-acetyltransferase
MPIPFETERLLIRMFRDNDLTSFQAYRNDEETARYQSWQVPYTIEMAKEFIDAVKNTPPGLPGEHYQLAIELKSSGEMIGDLAFWSKRTEPRSMSVGYTVARPHWKKGYAREAVSRLFDYLFFELGAHRVSADCDTKNVSSYRLMEDLGMRREAHFVQSFWMGNYWGDEYFYGILADEWRAKRTGRENLSAG